jgi:LPS-assembly lipoprotein
MGKSLRGMGGWLAGSMVLLLAGCGFYLKGEKPLPPELSVVHLDYRASGYEVVQSRLEESLRTQLKRRGARVVNSATGAGGRLTVHSLRQNARILSVGPTGKAIEYEIESTVDFDYSVDGRLRIPRESMKVFREYSFDESRVLATEAYGEQLRQEMQEELAELILLRIDALLSATPPATAPSAEPAG